jgi:CheY-like chemotaxis protein
MDEITPRPADVINATEQLLLKARAVSRVIQERVWRVMGGHRLPGLPRPPTEGRKAVLLVEDDDLTRQVFSLVLERQGHSVLAARDGGEALDLLRAGARPDCILLDLGLPGLDGRQLRACLRQDPAWAAIPVLLVSGDPSVAREAAALGAAGYLHKPVQPEDLLLALESPA